MGIEELNLNIIIHGFSRTQIIFAIASMMASEDVKSIETVYLLVGNSNGKTPNLVLISEALNSLNIKVKILENLESIYGEKISHTKFNIYSASTFPHKIIFILLIRQAKIKVYYTEEGLGSYTSYLYNIRSLWKQGWRFLAFRKMVAVPIFHFFRIMGISKKIRLINPDCSINLIVKNSIINFIKLMHSNNNYKNSIKIVYMSLPIDKLELKKWKSKYINLHIKPHPRFNLDNFTENLLPNFLLDLTAEECVYLCAPEVVIADHSSALVYSNILFDVISHCDACNRWNIADDMSLKLFNRYSKVLKIA